MSESEEAWEIDYIVTSKALKGGHDTSYLIRWVGFSPDDDSWHTLDELKDMGLSKTEISEAIAGLKNRAPTPKKSNPTPTPAPTNETWAAIEQQQKKAAQEWLQQQQLRPKPQKLPGAAVPDPNIAREEAAREAALRRERQDKIRAVKEGQLFELYAKIPSLDEKAKLLASLASQKVHPSSTRPTRTRSNIPTLGELSLASICNNLELYNGFENVPVEWKAKMFAWLARRRALTVEKFAVILDPEQSVLDLSLCSSSVTYDFFGELEKCRDLSKFVLKNNYHAVCDIGMTKLARSCPNLTHLDLSGCPSLSSACFKSLCWLGSLKTLILEGGSLIFPKQEPSWGEFTRSVKLWPELEKLVVPEIPYYWFLQVLKIHTLKTLHTPKIGSASGGSRHYSLIRGIQRPSLTDLKLGQIPTPVENLIPVLFPALEHIQLDWIGEDVLKTLSQNTKLKSLSSSFEKVGTSFPQMGDALESLELGALNTEAFDGLIGGDQLCNKKNLKLTHVSVVPMISLFRLWKKDLQAESLTVTAQRGRSSMNDWFSHSFQNKIQGGNSASEALEWADIGDPLSIQVNIHLNLTKLVLSRMYARHPTDSNVLDHELLDVTGCALNDPGVLGHIATLKHLRVLMGSTFEVPSVNVPCLNNIKVLCLQAPKSLSTLFPAFPELKHLHLRFLRQDDFKPVKAAVRHLSLHTLGLADCFPRKDSYYLTLASFVTLFKLRESEAGIQKLRQLARQEKIEPNWLLSPHQETFVESQFWPSKKNLKK